MGRLIFFFFFIEKPIRKAKKSVTLLRWRKLPSHEWLKILSSGGTSENQAKFVLDFSVCTASYGGFPGGSVVKNSTAMQETWRPRFDPWVGKKSFLLDWLHTPVFLPGKSHGQRSLTGYSPWGCKESDTMEQVNFSFYFLFQEPLPFSSALSKPPRWKLWTSFYQWED